MSNGGGKESDLSKVVLRPRVVPCNRRGFRDRRQLKAVGNLPDPRRWYDGHRLLDSDRMDP